LAAPCNLGRREPAIGSTLEPQIRAVIRARSQNRPTVAVVNEPPPKSLPETYNEMGKRRGATQQTMNMAAKNRTGERTRAPKRVVRFDIAVDDAVLGKHGLVSIYPTTSMALPQQCWYIEGEQDNRRFPLRWPAPTKPWPTTICSLPRSRNRLPRPLVAKQSDKRHNTHEQELHDPPRSWASAIHYSRVINRSLASISASTQM
jgi:hypothetical protein